VNSIGVKAARRPSHFGAGADHGAVKVDSQSGELQLLNLRIEQFAVKPHQRAQRALSKLLKPVDHRAVAGNARQSAQPCEQRIVGHIAQVAQAARADYQQTDHQQHQLTGAIIAAQLLRGKRALDARLQANQDQEAAQQFQTAI